MQDVIGQSSFWCSVPRVTWKPDSRSGVTTASCVASRWKS